MDPSRQQKAMLNARAKELGRRGWDVEFASDFSGLRSVQGRRYAAFVRWLWPQHPARRWAVAEAVLERRFGRPNREQDAVFSEWMAALLNQPVENAGPNPNPRLDKRKLRRDLQRAFAPFAGENKRSGAVEWSYELPLLAGWRLVTMVDTGGATRDFSFVHTLFSPEGKNCLVTSAFGLLGVGGMETQWDQLQPGEEEGAVACAERLARRFVQELAPALVEGL